MSGMRMTLAGSTQCDVIEEVGSFIGKDASGSFGIRPGAERFMTALSFGLSRFIRSDGETEYVACPGGILYFAANELRIATRLYIRNTDLNLITKLLNDFLVKDEEIVREVKRNLHKLDQEILKKLARESYGLSL